MVFPGQGLEALKEFQSQKPYPTVYSSGKDRCHVNGNQRHGNPLSEIQIN